MKKRKIIDLPKPTLELLARCAAVLKPPPALTLSEWADRYRVLSAESSAEPGRWHTDKAPYQREIMDAIGDPHIRKVVIMSAAQIGKTDAFILNPLGYYMDYAPAPILVMQPTLDMGQTFSKEQIYEAVFGYDGTADDTAITQHIKNIRAKLRVAGAGEVLQTIWGVGYQWQNEN